MEAYKFETTVLEDGMIKVPQFEEYIDRKIELFIILQAQKIEPKPKQTIDEFLEKWTGFAKGIEDPDTVKYNSLMEKYK